MTSTLAEASKQDVPTIVTLLEDMQKEIAEVPFARPVGLDAVGAALDEGVHWFLFKDENGHPFGTCFLQSLHNYWRRERRFYLGGFYIAPSHRKQGRFRALNAQLVAWAKAHGGVQILVHIDKVNAHSRKAFAAVGIVEGDLGLYLNHWGA